MMIRLRAFKTINFLRIRTLCHFTQLLTDQSVQQRRCISYSAALQVLDEIPERRNSHEHQPLDYQLCGRNYYPHLLSAHTKRGRVLEALRCFHRMNGLGIVPTKFNLCVVLNSCTKARNQLLGSQVHARIIRTGQEGNLFLNSALVDLYAKCDALVEAKKVFDSMEKHDPVSWTSIISGFAQNRQGKDVLLLFKDMLRTYSRPNCFTYSCVISSCTEFGGGIQYGALLHSHVTKLGFESNSFVASSLIDCYSNCGKLDHAVSIFAATSERDIILMNSMIAGYCQNLQGEEALKLFVQMWRDDEMGPTDHTLSSILNACGSLTVLQLGRQIHSFITKTGSESNVFVASSLIDMYSKCGSIDEARYIFDRQVQRNTILWTSMIMGYAQSGRGTDGLELFEQLAGEDDLRPDHVCFTAVLTACNHAGLLDKAIEYFDKMKIKYGLDPELDQYACLVDLYGRHGYLRKAKKLMEEMPFEPNSVMWTSFLGSCRVYREVELGREAAEELFKMEHYGVAAYVTLANIYAEAGMWGKVVEVRKMMREKEVKKSVGCSWIEVGEKVHVFPVNDTSHPQLQEVCTELERLNLEMRESFVPPILKYLSLDVYNEYL